MTQGSDEVKMTDERRGSIFGKASSELTDDPYLGVSHTIRMGHSGDESRN
jgi:hypothetical protein